MTDTPTGRHRAAGARRHGVLRAFGFGVLTLTLALGLFGAYTYRHLSENLTVVDLAEQLGSDRPEKVEVDGPQEPLNVLVMGSDSRDGAGNNIDGLAGGGQRSDTTILFHLSADRQRAYGVSLPRDAMVQRPTCYEEDGTEIPGGLSMWNTAFSLGGPACTIRQVEQLTGIHVDHFVVLDFNGFKDMVDAIDGVEVCIPEDVNDPTGNIYLDAGTRVVRGDEALDYVRVRHGISANGDIGRMKRQQAFIASMAAKVMSAGTLSRPDRLFGFLNAATQSLTLDKKLDSVRRIAELAAQFQGIGLENIRFITVPWDVYEPDPNRLVWTDEATLLWRKLALDQPLGADLSDGVITAARGADVTATPDPGVAVPEDSASQSTSETPSDASPSDAPTSEGPTELPSAAQQAAAAEEAARLAAENGLCA